MFKSKHRVFKTPNVGFCKQADFCGTSILNCLVLVCMLFCIKGNKKPVKCDRLVKRWSFLPSNKHRKSSSFGVYCYSALWICATWMHFQAAKCNNGFECLYGFHCNNSITNVFSPLNFACIKGGSTVNVNQLFDTFFCLSKLRQCVTGEPCVQQFSQKMRTKPFLPFINIIYSIFDIVSLLFCGRTHK